MKEISPRSEQVNRSLDDVQIDQVTDILIKNDDSYSTIAINNVGKKLSEVGSSFTISLEELNNNYLELNNTCITDEKQNTLKSCEAQVTVERNSEFNIECNHEKKLDTDVNIIVADTSDEIRPASDLDLAKSKDRKPKRDCQTIEKETKF